MNFLNSQIATAEMVRLNTSLIPPDSGVLMSHAMTMDSTLMSMDLVLAVDQIALEHTVVMESLM